MDNWRYRPLLRYCRNKENYSEKLITTTHQNGLRNMVLYRDLKTVLNAFKAKKIDAIILKGAYLADIIYPFGIRPVDDIDLLIKPENLNQANLVLEKLGYSGSIIGLPLWMHSSISGKITYVNNNKINIPIDLHTKLGAYPYMGKINFKTIWENVTDCKIQDINCKVFTPELLLLHLCLHLIQHLNDGWLTPCCDISVFTNNVIHPLDWDKFLSLVSSLKLQTPVTYSLEKAEKLFEIKIPNYVKETLTSKKSSPFSNMIFEYNNKCKNESERYLLEFLTTPGICIKFACAVQMIFPKKNYLNMHFSGSYIKYLSTTIKFIYKFILKCIRIIIK